ncbi:MAG: RnfABCDGE type electron transport complex subunit B [Clostridia bacterium]|nr:RnfABCDGE type electron transport complex subunit B [Clostridia bacterium]
MTILSTTLVIAVVGLIVGCGLVFTAKKFAVKVDEKESAVRAKLPGNNCGACGFAGCDALAGALSRGEAPVNACPVGGSPVAKEIGAIMGVDAADVERKVAFIACKGSCEVTKNQGNYIGIRDCRAAVMSGISVTDCSYGCLGFGSCAEVCPENAIVVKDGVAVVNRNRCVGCGLCTKTCPRKLISLIPVSRVVQVQCSNHDKGPAVKKICSAGCIGCTLCVRQCEFGAMTFDGNLARVDSEKCTLCGKCAAKCPAKVITSAVGPA